MSIIHSRIAVPFGCGGEEPLAAPVQEQPLFDFRRRGPCRGKIRFIDDNHIGRIEHRDLLKLEAAPILGTHYQDRRVHLAPAKWSRLLTDANGFDKDDIERAIRREILQDVQALHSVNIPVEVLVPPPVYPTDTPLTDMPTPKVEAWLLVPVSSYSKSMRSPAVFTGPMYPWPTVAGAAFSWRSLVNGEAA